MVIRPFAVRAKDIVSVDGNAAMLVTLRHR